MIQPFVHRRQVTWGDTDSARIVYTPRVAHFAVEAIEAWFADRLGAGFFDMPERLGFGTPFVHMEVDFKAPMTPHDTLDTRVLLARAGASSFHFALDSRAPHDRLCWTGRFVCACVGKGFTPVPIPDHLRPLLDAETALAAALLPP